MSNVIVNKEKIDLLANAIANKSGESLTLTLDEMVDAVDGIETGGGGITPTGNIDITSAGTTDVTNYATATVAQGEMYAETYNQYYTENNQLKWRYRGTAQISTGDGYGTPGYIDDNTVVNSDWITHNAIATGTSVTPTESAQTIGGSRYMMQGAVTVNAIPSNYVGSGITQRTSSDLSASGATVTAPSGYYASSASKSVASGTEGTPTATKGNVSNHSISVTPSVTNSAGYISGGTHNGTAVSVSASELVSGTYTVSSSGTADVTNYASASVPAAAGLQANIYTDEATMWVDNDGIVHSFFEIYDEPIQIYTAGWVDEVSGQIPNSSANAQVSGELQLTTRSSSDLTVNGATVTAPSGYYASSASTSVSSQTLPSSASSSYTGRNIAFIRSDIGSSPSPKYINIPTGYNSTAQYYTIDPVYVDSVTLTQNGTYYAEDYDLNGFESVTVNVSGGGTSAAVSETNVMVTTATSSISFTNLLGEPTSFVVLASDDIATGASPYKVAMIVYDGTSDIGQTITNTSNAQVSYNGSDFSHSYSNGTLTVTASTTQFQANTTYFLTYSYGGSAANIHTADVQVGSGATSITFTGLEDEPLYWSCIFKSNFSTSSGYQRVIGVFADSQNDRYGLCMDSAAHFSLGYWSSSYSNGSLTITSQGTNAGGYFHQPGYYQLTYALADASPYQKINKSYYATTTQQTEKIEASSGYDAIGEVNVTVSPISQTNLTAANIKSGTTVTINNGSTNIYSVTGTYSGGGGGSATVATTTWTNSDSTATSHTFSSLSGTPIAAFLRCTSSLSRSSSSSNYFIADMVWTGSACRGNSFRRSNGTYANVTSGYSASTSSNSITFTSSGTSTTNPGSFYNGTYELTYIY